MENIKTSALLELVCIDFWSAEDSNNKSVDVLVITNHFAKLAHAFQCQDQTAKTVAKKLWDGFFCVYGFPQRIHSDQGANFESELLAELLQLSGVGKSHTSPYHPMGNGATERFNRTLGNMLRSLPPRSKPKWPQMIQSMTFAYNCTAHETPGFAPFYLMFGRVSRLPVDLMFQNVLHDDTTCDYNTYVKSLVDDLRLAMLRAQENSTMEQKHQSDQYNKRTRGLPLSLGDQVLVASKGIRGKRKLSDKWDPVVYTVVASKPTLHIYRVRDRAGNEWVVHRNLLLQVNFLPLDINPDNDVAPVPPPASGLLDVSLPSNEQQSEMSQLETSALSVAPSMADSLQILKAWHGHRVATWVREQSSIGGLSAADSSPSSPAAADSASGSPAPDMIDPLPSNSPVPDVESDLVISPPEPVPSAHPGPLRVLGVDNFLTSRFGRVIRPVCRLIESMAQIESNLEVEPERRAIIHV